MKRKIVRDESFLSLKSYPASKKDQYVIDDLIDTYNNLNEDFGLSVPAYCSGLSANMIGERKNIILICIGVVQEIMVNPVIIDKKDPYEAEEYCLSVKGPHKAIRYKTITVRFRDEAFTPRTETFHGVVAQVIQHEIDHTKGILI